MQVKRLPAPLMTRGLFVTGTGTEVGKTVVTAALAHAFLRQGVNVGVVKPIATGCQRRGGKLISSDAEKLLRASGAGDPTEWVCPYRFRPPVAPSVAAGKQGISFSRIDQAMERLSSRHDLLLVEGIGGLLVPLDARRTVVDLAAHLKLPLLVVAHAGLGTLNHTLLTLEAARSRNLEVAGIVLNQRSPTPSLAEQTNPAVLRKLGQVPVLGVIPHLRFPSPEQVAGYLKAKKIFQKIGTRYQTQTPCTKGSDPFVQRLRSGHVRKVQTLSHRYLVPKAVPKAQAKRLIQSDRKRLWHPFTQMQDWEKEESLIIRSARGVWLTDIHGRRYLDGVSSLWVNLHGHRHPALDQALKQQVDRVAHSTLLGAANIPSIELAEEILRVAPKNLTRVFYSDSGSTAVEIALKMAFQYWQQNGRPRRRRFVHFVDAYHGDTVGSVSVGGIDLFHQVYKPLLFKGFKVPLNKIKPFEETLRKHHPEIAGVVVEPLVQGAAGMATQPKGWLKQVERLCRRYGLLLIADEVAVGFGRTGTMFACEQEKVRPDLLCLAKGLSGGYLPLAATLASERIYKGFLGSYASKRTFFHGHSYTGNPLACAVALESLRLFRREKVLQRLKPKIRLFTQELKRFWELPHVGDVRQQGLMAGIELTQDKAKGTPYPWETKMGIQVCSALRAEGILLRPLGNVVVLMPPLVISREELNFLCRKTYTAVDRVTGI